jgi:molybdate transport system regulatory protein
MAKKSSYQLRGRIWIENQNEAFLGVGRVELLRKIQEFGSITKAAKAMKMSYRQAWEMIDSMNKKAKSPLVEKQSGGKGGGGAVLTKEGEKAIVSFTTLREEFYQFLEMKNKELNL